MAEKKLNKELKVFVARLVFFTELLELIRRIIETLLLVLKTERNLQSLKNFFFKIILC